jgi:hypothetical protein
MQDRLRMSARTCSSVAEWSTQMSRSLQLPAPSARYSDALIMLDNAVDDVGAQPWLSMIDSEYGLLMALARASAERRKEAKNA